MTDRGLAYLFLDVASGAVADNRATKLWTRFARI
jgi:hypothetical protein